MQWWEVSCYLAGIRRRYRPQWETTRALQWWIGRMFGDKNNLPRKPTDLYKFPWEEHEAVITEAEVAELQAELDALNASAGG